MLRHYFQYQMLVFYIGIVQNYLNCSIPRNQEIRNPQRFKSERTKRTER